MAFLDVGGRSWEDLATDSAVVHMGHNCNQLPLDGSIDDAMISLVREGAYRNYPPPYGTDELRAAIQGDVAVEDTEVLVTNGATEAIYQALALVLREPGEMIVSDPAWPHIASFARSLGSSVVDVPVYAADCAYKLSPQLLERFISNKTRAIAIIDPLNPLGSSYGESEIRAICDIAARRGIYVLHDCTYRDFSPAFVPALNYYDRVVMTISLSKSCGFAGLRLGALIARPALFHQIVDNQIARLGVNIVTQAGAMAAYRSKPVWLPTVLETNRINQHLLKACVDSVDGLRALVYPSMGNFLAVDVTQTGSLAEDIVRSTLEAGFVIRSGAYTSQEFGERFIRVTTTVPTENVERFCTAFPAAVSRMAKASTNP